MATFPVHCPKCGHENLVDESWRGKRIRCPKCQTSFKAGQEQSIVQLVKRSLSAGVANIGPKVSDAWYRVEKAVPTIFAAIAGTVVLIIVLKLFFAAPEQRQQLILLMIFGAVCLIVVLLILREIVCWWIKTTALLNTEKEILSTLKEILAVLARRP